MSFLDWPEPVHDLPGNRIRVLRDLGVPFHAAWRIGLHDRCWRRLWSELGHGTPWAKAINVAANTPKAGS